MTPDEIRTAILADPQLRTLAEAGNDDGVARELSTRASGVPSGELYTERSMFAELGPVVADSILSKLEQFAASGNSGGSVVARGLKWLQPNNGGLDFQHPSLVQMLAGLHVAGVITADELAALRGLGLRPQTITHQQVSRALKQWRPDGRPCPLPTEV